MRLVLKIVHLFSCTKKQERSEVGNTKLSHKFCLSFSLFRVTFNSVFAQLGKLSFQNIIGRNKYIQSSICSHKTYSFFLSIECALFSANVSTMLQGSLFIVKLCTYFQHFGIQIPQYSSYSATYIAIRITCICKMRFFAMRDFLSLCLIRLILFDVTLPTSQSVLQIHLPHSFHSVCISAVLQI